MMNRLVSLRPRNARTTRISTLIDEEVLNLSMLGLVSEGVRSEGARPLNDLELAGAGGGRLAISDIWNIEVPATMMRKTELADLLEKHQAAASRPTGATAHSMAARDTRVPLMLVAVLVALAVAGVAWWLLRDLF